MQNQQPHPKFFHENKFYYISIAAAAVIAALILFWPHTARSQMTFGKCLTEKGIIMYGSDQCDNCLQQKQYFKEDFPNIKYINCDIYFDICESRSIRSYPVWNLGETYLKGVKTLSELSEWSGCPLTYPNEN